MSERLTDQQLQILWEQWNPAAVEIQELRARVVQLEAALKQIGKHKLDDEMCENGPWGSNHDFVESHDQFIGIARAALGDKPSP